MAPEEYVDQGRPSSTVTAVTHEERRVLFRRELATDSRACRRSASRRTPQFSGRAICRARQRRTLMDATPRHPLQIAIVAPSMRILGGQAVQAERLLRGWSDDGEVRAWLVPTNPAAPGILRRAATIKYIRTIVTQLIFLPSLVGNIRQAEVVHAFSASYSSFLLSTLPAVLVGKLLRRPVIVHYHSGEALDHLRRSAAARYVLGRLTAANVVPSRFLHEVFAGFGLPSHVIANTVETDRFEYHPRGPLAPRLLSTRNLEAHYNVACTLRAFRIVQQHRPDATLTLVGSGSQEASLRRLASDLALRNVTFAGRVPPDDIWKYYAEADIYLQSPEIDNMPLSVLEAFASGCPVVSTDVGGVSTLVGHEHTGLLVPRDDAAALSEQVLRLLRDPGLAERLARHAHDECDRYTWPAVRQQWLSLYRSLAGPRGLPGHLHSRSLAK